MQIEAYNLIWLLLPLAAASGWFAARRSLARAPTNTRPAIDNQYFEGLNYLLDEQPDKAIEVFIKMLDVNSDTVETHLALGNLFRRRGEVDRAIRVHQNLIAKPTLNRQQRDHALFELAQDYMRAGLLDRAEGLLRELVDKNAHIIRALTDLQKIYQQEKDWESAMGVVARLSDATGVPMNAVIAQYCCEIAELFLEKQDFKQAARLADRALKYSAGCVRASIIKGNLARLQDDPARAIDAYKRVEQQDPEFLPEVLVPMRACYESLGRVHEMIDLLKDVVARNKGVSVTLMLADLLLQYEGEQQAAEFVEDQLQERPSVRGLERLVELNLSHGGVESKGSLVMLRNLIRQLLEDKPTYKCTNCGFSGKGLHWLCPSCKQWDTVKPIHGVEGD